MSEERDVGLASVLGRWETRRERAAKGVIHIKGSEQSWELNRQGRCRFYAHLGRTDDLSVPHQRFAVAEVEAPAVV